MAARGIVKPQRRPMTKAWNDFLTSPDSWWLRVGTFTVLGSVLSFLSFVTVKKYLFHPDITLTKTNIANPSTQQEQQTQLHQNTIPREDTFKLQNRFLKEWGAPTVSSYQSDIEAHSKKSNTVRT
eukprot:TRINITY_DN140_c0_g1_i1.p1 TRINITY_DN140_c0_g1~~TRINITY_DN140_c0_g1_i1.p1  ORF type:complete len:143 (-),score=37.16 TRINITY_DN140_c0_g1_i1:117-491(-)